MQQSELRLSHHCHLNRWCCH